MTAVDNPSMQQNIFAQIRESCQLVVQHSHLIKLNMDAVHDFVQNHLDVNTVKQVSQCIGFPFTFSNDIEEINFLAILQLLNLGSGYRKELHTMTGKGSWDTILFGVISMFPSGHSLTTDFLVNLSLSDVANFFNLPLHQEQSLPNSPIKISVDGPLKPLIQMIHSILIETGRILRTRRYASLGHFIVQSINLSEKFTHDSFSPCSSSNDSSSSSSSSDPMTASDLILRLADTLPAFRDEMTIPIEIQPQGDDSAAVTEMVNVKIYKKAQVFCSELYRRFQGRSTRFSFPDIDQLTVFADNVVACVVQHLKILELSPELTAKIEQGQELCAEEATILRAFSIVACDAIVSMHNARADVTKINATELDTYFWGTLGKSEQVRKLPRHVNKKTCFY